MTYRLQRTSPLHLALLREQGCRTRRGTRTRTSPSPKAGIPRWAARDFPHQRVRHPPPSSCPAPSHVVRVAIAVLGKAGLGEGEACQLVIDICDAFMRRTAHDDNSAALNWVYQVQSLARVRIGRQAEQAMTAAPAPR